jgi:tetratricopeptide (TPR) repeat protein
VKRIIRPLVILGVVSVAVYVVASVMRRRQASPVPQRWTPPTVEPPPAEKRGEAAEQAEVLAEEIAQAESEGMPPPHDFPATDIALDEGGSVVQPEAVATETGQPAPEHEELASAESEGMAPPQDLPPADIALDAGGVIVEPEAVTIEAEAAAPEHEEVVSAEAEGMTPGVEEAPVDMGFSANGAPLVAEPSADGAPLAEDEGLDFAEMLEAAEHGRDLLEELPGVADEVATPAATAEADVVTEAFKELAATMVEAEAPAREAVPEAPAAPADEQLLDSVEQALTDLEPAAIVPPPRRTAESYLDEGNVYFNVGQYGLAIERYTQAIELDGDLTAAFYNRANARTRSGDLENALLDYDRALELQPNDADALNNRGMLHLYRANYAAALQDFNGALAADPTDSTVMVNRGLAHLHGGDAAAGLVDFREAIRVDATDAAAQYGAAQASATLGNRDEALRHVGRALEIDPAYAREAAADPKLAMLQGDEDFLKLLRQSGSGRE